MEYISASSSHAIMNTEAPLTTSMGTWEEWEGLNSSFSNSSEVPRGWLPPNVSHNTVAVVLWYVHLYCTPPIIVLGLVGNCFSFLVFTRTNQRHLSSSVYLAALAVVDSTFLLQLMLLWPTYLRVFLIHQQGLCQLVIYISYVSSFLSVWIVVAFTVERFIVCMDPLRRSTMCTPGRAKIVVISLSVFALVAYSYNMWTSSVFVNEHSHKECMIRVQFQSLVDVVGLIDSFITLVLPVLAIIIMNMKIIGKLLYFKDQPMTSTTTSTCAASSLRTSYATRGRSQMKVTKMLLVVSTIFLILNVPSHLVRVYDTFQTFFNPSYAPPKYLLLLQQFFTFLFNCNFSVNFFLYSLCGTSFRKALSALMLRYWHRLARVCYMGRRPRHRRGPGGGREGSPFKLVSVFHGGASMGGTARTVIELEKTLISTP
jgi:hypothetical protein